MKDLNIKFFTEAHLDPDLRASTLASRSPEWKPIFGQKGAAQTILDRSSVAIGDIFLFYGWFKEVEKVNDKFRYKKAAGNIHAIWGYLEIEEILNVKTAKLPKWAKYHPHIRLSSQYEENNTLYLGKKGSGNFNYDDKLVLTDPSSKNRSVWKLPSYFREVESDFKAKIDVKDVANSKIQLTFTGKNQQELLITDNHNIVNWAKSLIKNCKTYS